MRIANPAEMVAIGKRIGAILRPGDVVALTGGLGAGKTTLVRGLLRSAGHGGEVPSPSFAIVQPYEPPLVRLPIAHVDLYRVEKGSELAELGLDDWLNDGALVIEWPDLLGEAMLGAALRIDIAVMADDARNLTVAAPPGWEDRWPIP